MKAEIKQRKENPALQREEVLLEILDISSTPSRKEVRAKIAALTGKDEELVVVGNISQNFGSKSAEAKANVYKNKEALEATEHKWASVRNFGKKEEAKEGGEEKPAEAASEEKPAEGGEEKKEGSSEGKEAPKEEVKEDKKEGKGEEKPAEEEKKE